MNQNSNFVTDNQSSVSAGVLKGGSEGALESVFEDLSVQDAEMIKGGPVDHTIYVPMHVIVAR